MPSDSVPGSTRPLSVRRSPATRHRCFRMIDTDGLKVYLLDTNLCVFVVRQRRGLREACDWERYLSRPPSLWCPCPRESRHPCGILGASLGHPWAFIRCPVSPQWYENVDRERLRGQTHYLFYEEEEKAEEELSLKTEKTDLLLYSFISNS